MAPEDPNLNVIQTKMFKRRRRATAVLDGDPQRGLPPKCCHRCKSDLNGKLMVRCATCSFRCHLYCFSPPLKQHPAFRIRRQQQTPQNGPDEPPPVWKCEKCEGTSVVFTAKPRPFSSAARSPKKLSSEVPSTKRSNTQFCAKTVEPSQTGTEDKADPGLILPVQPQWLEKSEVMFDWYRFRSEKAEVFRHHGSGTNHNRSGVDELVYYSKSYALIKKTAAIWRAHVLKKQRFRRLQELETTAIRFPEVKYDVMHAGQTSRTSMASVVCDDYLVEDSEDDGNLTDANHYTLYSRRPRLPLLWEDEPPSALMWWTSGERVEIAEVLNELEEQVCLATEDFDAVEISEEDIDSVTEAEVDDPEVSDVKLKAVQFHKAALIIQRVMTQHYRWRRRRERTARQRRALEEATRRAKARLSVALLRTCIQFIVLLMKMLGRARTKKAMLLVLSDATEETRVKTSTLAKNEDNTGATKILERERTQKLAEVRIRRFFVRRVHPYVKLKKVVMARRLQRWWKRKPVLQKWRETAIALGFSRRTHVCLRIQRFYRYSRTRRQFRALIEESALKTLRQALAGWLFSRLAKKEAKRCAVYEAAQLSGIGSVENPAALDAPLDEILEKRGLELFNQGDFWSAASILERLCEMKKGNLTNELQQALAYSHHMTWYISYDQFNLTRAHELYCSVLNPPNGERSRRVDPSVLQDFAIVMMHMEHFGDSLRLLAKLIEYFARQPEFTLWLLLAAVQLQQSNEWEQSVGYLTYLHDIPPPPYLERDILVLCAMGYEQWAATAPNACEARTSKNSLAKGAWSAAIRQWNVENATTARPGSASVTRYQRNGRTFTSREKWELLTSLGQRALEQGHYLLACRVFLYALEREVQTINDRQETQTAWWNLADAFRHLGHLELYLNSAQRSQTTVDDELLRSWRELADQQACCFQTELRTLSVLEKLRQLGGNAK